MIEEHLSLLGDKKNLNKQCTLTYTPIPTYL